MIAGRTSCRTGEAGVRRRVYVTSSDETWRKWVAVGGAWPAPWAGLGDGVHGEAAVRTATLEVKYE